MHVCVIILNLHKSSFVFLSIGLCNPLPHMLKHPILHGSGHKGPMASLWKQIGHSKSILSVKCLNLLAILKVSVVEAPEWKEIFQSLFQRGLLYCLTSFSSRELHFYNTVFFLSFFFGFVCAIISNPKLEKFHFFSQYVTSELTTEK